MKRAMGRVRSTCHDAIALLAFYSKVPKDKTNKDNLYKKHFSRRPFGALILKLHEIDLFIFKCSLEVFGIVHPPTYLV